MSFTLKAWCMGQYSSLTCLWALGILWHVRCFFPESARALLLFYTSFVFLWLLSAAVLGAKLGCYYDLTCFAVSCNLELRSFTASEDLSTWQFVSSWSTYLPVSTFSASFLASFAKFLSSPYNGRKNDYIIFDINSRELRDYLCSQLNFWLEERTEIAEVYSSFISLARFRVK